MDKLTFTERPLVFFIDVVSMYTNIDNIDGMLGVREMLLTLGTSPTRVTFLLKLLSWVHRNNFLEYDGNVYRQVQGTAMRSNFAPAYANLFMAHHETEMWKVLPKPLIYKRYLDDILIVVKSEAEFQ